MEVIALPELLRFGAALVFVLALMTGLGLVLKRINTGSFKGRPIKEKRRLGVTEMMSLDARRHLVLIQRDDREHLVILGPNGETVIETSIESSAPEEKEENEDKTAK